MYIYCHIYWANIGCFSRGILDNITVEITGIWCSINEGHDGNVGLLVEPIYYICYHHNLYEYRNFDNEEKRIDDENLKEVWR